MSVNLYESAILLGTASLISSAIIYCIEFVSKHRDLKVKYDNLLDERDKLRERYEDLVFDYILLKRNTDKNDHPVSAICHFTSKNRGSLNQRLPRKL